VNYPEWGVFVTKENDSIVQLDVAPSNDEFMANDHIRGEWCPCHPSRAPHPQGIPLFVHDYQFCETVTTTPNGGCNDA
jgi:hypothetical protein